MKRIESAESNAVYAAADTKKIMGEEQYEQLFAQAEKHPFLIQYVPFTKGTVLSALNHLGCRWFKQLDFANCVAVSLNRTQLKEICKLGCVKAIEPDHSYQVLSAGKHCTKVVPHLEGYYSVGRKETIKLAVFDTDVFDTLVVDYVWFADEARNDDGGHGTLMAEIVLTHLFDRTGFIAEPRVYSAVVANYNGIARTSAIMEGIDWAIRNEMHIISMSFGGHYRSALLEEMIDRAANHGIIMVAAAGNDGTAYPIQYPAAFTNVLSVGAKKEDLLAAYSNGGENADCYASGMQYTMDLNGYHVCVTGTSGAAAYVAGMVLKSWCRQPDLTPSEIMQKIKNQMTISSKEDFTAPKVENVDENEVWVARETVAFFRRMQ